MKKLIAFVALSIFFVGVASAQVQNTSTTSEKKTECTKSKECCSKSAATQSAEKNFIDPLVKKFDEMIAAFMAKDTNVVVNTSSESIPAEPYSEEQLANYKLSGINF